MLNNKTAKAKKTSPDNRNTKSVIIKIILGAVISCFTFIIITSLTSAYILKNPVNSSLYMFIVYTIFFISSFTGGFLTSRLIKKNGMIFGILSSIFLLVLVIITSFIVSKENISYRLIISMLIIVFSSSLGGIAAVNLKKSRK